MFETAYIAIAVFMAIFSLYGILLSYRVCLMPNRCVPASGTMPPVSLIIPCKGDEPGLELALAAHFNHDYPRYEIVFAVDSPDDSAVPVIRNLMQRHPSRPAKLVVAPQLPDCVAKISNQFAAIEAANPATEIFAFADSDGMVRDEQWLTSLVRPLETHDVSSGFRWYFPESRGLSARFHAAWDSALCMLHANTGTVWGGAMAFRKSFMQKMDLLAAWRTAATDDLMVKKRCDAVGGRVAFAPGAMVISEPIEALVPLWSWSVRQTLLVRATTFKVFARAGAFSCMFALYYAATLAAFTWPGAVTTILLPACALAIHALLIIGRVAMRRQAMFHLFPDHQARLRHIRWHFAIFLPVADIVSFFVVVRAAIARGFVWRGIRYRIAKDGIVRV